MRLQAKDLRIGNRVLRCGNLYEERDKFHEIVVDNRDINACFISPTSFQPIPLTEEWLRRAGFEYDEDEFMGFILSSHLGISIGKSEEGVWYYFGNLEGYWVGLLPELNYVHQLQNLYFALTGEEIEFNQTT